MRKRFNRPELWLLNVESEMTPLPDTVDVLYVRAALNTAFSNYQIQGKPRLADIYEVARRLHETGRSDLIYSLDEVNEWLNANLVKE